MIVDVAAAALNRRDWWIWTDPTFCELPVTMGSDAAGTVSSVGEGVFGIEPGDEVVVDATLNWGEDEDRASSEFDILGVPTAGTFAERVEVPAENVRPKPRRLGWEEAAALNLGGLTAWRAAATRAQAAPGRTVLVTGCGGGVSTFAVQIAAALGAHVFVTSGSDEKIARAVELGAEAGFRYDDPEWPAQARSRTGGGIDVVIDSYGAPTWPMALRALRDGGLLVSFGDTGGADAGVDVSEVYWHWRSIVGTTMGSPREFTALVEHVKTATWTPVVDSVFPLERVTDAVERLDSSERFGKVVLAIGNGR